MANENTNWIVDVGRGDGETDTCQVTACKPYTDDRYFPGFIQLRDADGTLVALVPMAAAPLIRRADSDPTLRPRSAAPQGPVPGPPPHTSPSPAALAELASRGGKPGQV